MSENYVPYWKKLLDVRWQRKRLEIFNRDEFMCRSCGVGEAGVTLCHGIRIWVWAKAAEDREWMIEAWARRQRDFFPEDYSI